MFSEASVSHSVGRGKEGSLHPKGSASVDGLHRGGGGGSASRGVCIHLSVILSTGVCIQGGLPPGGSASKGGRVLHPGGLPMGVCLRGVCLKGIYIRGGSAYRRGLHPEGSASEGSLHPGGSAQSPY